MANSIIDEFPITPSFDYLKFKFRKQGLFIVGVGASDYVPDVDPTSTNIISGNVTKLGLPFGAVVVAVSLGIDPEILGSTTSDSITGDYSIDVYPHVDEVLIYLAPDYGFPFNPDNVVVENQIIHPTVPNGNVYIALNEGTVGPQEPIWNDVGVTSGDVLLSALPLHKPLMNGFIKPVVTPI